MVSDERLWLLMDKLKEFNHNRKDRTPEDFNTICSLATEFGYMVVPKQMDEYALDFSLVKMEVT